MLRPRARPHSTLGEPYAVDVLLRIAEREPATATDLLPIISNYRTVTAALENLSEVGLIKVDVVNRPRVAFKITMTPKGRKVAEKLREAKELIGE